MANKAFMSTARVRPILSGMQELGLAVNEARRILAETEPIPAYRAAEYHDGHGLALCGVQGRPDCQQMFCALAEALAAFVAEETR